MPNFAIHAHDSHGHYITSWEGSAPSRAQAIPIAFELDGLVTGELHQVADSPNHSVYVLAGYIYTVEEIP
jgi:hypothetical protein